VESLDDDSNIKDKAMDSKRTSKKKEEEGEAKSRYEV
jgi:hypothetical protein